MLYSIHACTMFCMLYICLYYCVMGRRPESRINYLLTYLHYFFRASIRPCVHRPSICPSRYLPLNHWAEFNRTCFITSPHGKGVREQHYFSLLPSFRASVVVHMSITLPPPKPLGGIQPNLLHHFPLW